MKKLSGILRIALEYNWDEEFGFKRPGLCIAISDCRHLDLISAEESKFATVAVTEMIRSFHPGANYLWHALFLNTLPSDERTMYMIWNAVIDKLESEGE